jgi:hypothetical protein
MVRHSLLDGRQDFHDPASMHSQTSSSRADLEFAEVALRDVLVEDFKREARADAMSLDRILVHIVNMGEAISTPERHSNVAKRLDDFATTTSRMAERNPDAAPKLSRASEALRTASERLRAASHKTSAEQA